MKRIYAGPFAMVVVITALCLWVAGCAFTGPDGESTTTSGAVSSSTSSAPSTEQPTSTAPVPTGGQPSTTVAPTTTASSTTTSLLPTTTAPSSTTTSTNTGTTAKPAKDYTRIPTEEKVVALTFDAAYDPAPLKDILAALEAAEADATFFLTGEFVRDFPEHTKKIIAGGYPVGNHSYSHPDFTELSDKAMRSEMSKMSAALAKVGGEDPKPLFRAPYGALNKRVLSVLGSEGYVSVYWTIDTLDWKPERTPEQVKATVLDKLKPGAIVLMHVGSKQTAKVLPELLTEIESRGYRFVNLRDAVPEAGD